jgi:hypothetical protein
MKEGTSESINSKRGNDARQNNTKREEIEGEKHITHDLISFLFVRKTK